LRVYDRYFEQVTLPVPKPAARQKKRGINFGKLIIISYERVRKG